jgi:hypothetical protein
MTGLGAADLFHANMVAREMILSAGKLRRLLRCTVLRYALERGQVHIFAAH